MRDFQLHMLPPPVPPAGAFEDWARLFEICKELKATEKKLARLAGEVSACAADVARLQAERAASMASLSLFDE